MSKVETMFGYFSDFGLFDDEVVETDQSFSNPAWSVQDAALPIGFNSPGKINGSPAAKPAVSQSPPASAPFDLRWDKGNNRLSFGKAHGEGLYSPLFLDFGDIEPFTSDAHEGSGSSSTGSSRQSPLGAAACEQEQTSSSDTDGNGGGQIHDLAVQPVGPEVTSDVAQGVSFDRQWEGIVDLVGELASRIAGSSSGFPFCKAEQQQPIKRTFSLPFSPLVSSDLGLVNSGDVDDVGMEHLLTPSAEVVALLTAIQGKVEHMKTAVPGLANDRHKFTFRLRRQAAAAAGAVKLIAQLADAAVSIIPEMRRELDQASTESCQTIDSSSDHVERSALPYSPGNFPELCSGGSIVEKFSRDDAGPLDGVSVPILDTVGDSSVDRKCIANAATSGDYPLECFMGATAPAVPDARSGLVYQADECSSLVADLLESVDRSPGVIKIKASPPSILCGVDELWSADLSDGLGDGPLITDSKQSGEGLEADCGPYRTLAEASGEEQGNPGAGSSPGHEESDECDARVGEHLPEGSYTLMEIDDEQILTEPTHCCNICFKEFKRDANLRMHMRSHGGKFKSSTALVRSARAPKPTQEMVGGKPTRYSCPYAGCSRNSRHPKFQALKTLLCLKNHYRRSHCAKTLRCSICKTKQFSVVADLKTHEKHCGSDKWACCCGTTFSRKEKLYSHVSMFVGHVPVDPSVAMDVVMGVDMRSGMGSATSLAQALRQVSDQPQREASKLDSSTLWKNWENNPTCNQAVHL